MSKKEKTPIGKAEKRIAKYRKKIAKCTKKQEKYERKLDSACTFLTKLQDEEKDNASMH
jgi:hypothetical protein